jgi:hypothetical protein
MATKYGIAIEKWAEAKEQLRQALVERASEGGTISYSELVDRLETVRLEPDSFALANMLGEISQDEDAAGRGMLSVIVVHKTGDAQPGSGFFQLAKKLGKDTGDKTVFWIQELRRVHGYWRNRDK